jgi:hypothetical protein
MPPGLDAIEWKAGLAVKAFNLTVGFRSSTEEGLDRILPALPSDWRPTPARQVDLLYSVVAEGGKYRLYAGNGVCGGPVEAAYVPELAAASLRAECVERVTDRVFVDAAVVGYKGRALMLLGNRWSGRSALLVELLREGATYYSHAFAPIDARGRVHPFAQPLAFRRQDDEPLREWDLGSLRCGTKPLPVSLVALPTLRPSEKWAPTELSPAMTLGRLFGHTSNARRLGKRAFHTLRRTVTKVVALEGHRDDAQATARALLERLRKSA